MHEFGARVNELLEERGMNVSVLSERIRERTGDEDLTEAALAGMLEDARQFGQMEIPTTFVSMIEILDLPEEQIEELQDLGRDVVRREWARERG